MRLSKTTARTDSPRPTAHVGAPGVDRPPVRGRTDAPEPPGPDGKAAYPLALGLAALGLLSFFAIIILAAELAFTWEWALFAIPASLLALAARYALRSFSP